MNLLIDIHSLMIEAKVLNNCKKVIIRSELSIAITHIKKGRTLKINKDENKNVIKNQSG